MIKLPWLRRDKGSHKVSAPEPPARVPNPPGSVPNPFGGRSSAWFDEDAPAHGLVVVHDERFGVSVHPVPP